MKSEHSNPHKQEIELDQRIPQLPEPDQQVSSSDQKEEREQAEGQQPQLEQHQLSEKQNEEMDKHQQSEIQQKTKKKKIKTKGKPLYAVNKPKAPTSCYLHFLHENKSKIVAKYGVNLNSEVAKIASEEWKRLTESEKQPYFKKSQQQKQKYHQAMKTFRETHAEEIKQQKKRRKLKYRSKQISKKKKHQPKPSPQKEKQQQNDSSSQAINSHRGIVKSKRKKQFKKHSPNPKPNPNPTTLTPTIHKILPSENQQPSSLQL